VPGRSAVRRRRNRQQRKGEGRIEGNLRARWFPHFRSSELLRQAVIIGHPEWPKKVVGIGRAICYARSAIVHEFFDILVVSHSVLVVGLRSLLSALNSQLFRATGARSPTCRELAERRALEIVMLIHRSIRRRCAKPRGRVVRIYGQVPVILKSDQKRTRKNHDVKSSSPQPLIPSPAAFSRQISESGYEPLTFGFGGRRAIAPRGRGSKERGAWSQEYYVTYPFPCSMLPASTKRIANAVAVQPGGHFIGRPPSR
jgi:hypothetical protein